MVKLINWMTGNEMYVAEDRLESYLKAGHKLPKTEPVKEPVAEKPKARKKASKK